MNFPERKKCISFEEQKGTTYNWGNLYFSIIIFSCLLSTWSCLEFLLHCFLREMKGFYQSSLENEAENDNVFNNYFASVADTAKLNINYSHKHFFEYLKHQCNNSIFIWPTDCEEIANIISSLNINKTCGPFSIPNKILILLKHDISKQLADLFNLSFSSGSFPSILKTAKVVPVFKTGSKLDCCNYHPIYLLSNVEKILEKLMYNFLSHNNYLWPAVWFQTKIFYFPCLN